MALDNHTSQAWTHTPTRGVVRVHLAVQFHSNHGQHRSANMPANTGNFIAVSIDQLLWWVDLAGWTISGFATFPIGVAKYLTWPNTSFATRITATHHLWTIPLALYAVGGQLHWESYVLSVYVVTSHVLLSRWLTPFTIQGIRKNDNAETKDYQDKYQCESQP